MSPPLRPTYPRPAILEQLPAGPTIFHAQS